MAYTIAYRIVHNKEDAEEIVQDSFLRVFKSLAKFHGDSKFSTWFYKIVVNQSLSKVKAMRKNEQDIDVEEVSENLVEGISTAYRQLAVGEQKKFIGQALEELDVEDRLLLTLYYLDENSIQEVAEITSISGENVKMKLHRARRKLYHSLARILKSEIHSII